MAVAIVECGACGQSFMGEGSRCSGCVAERRGLTCWACGTRLLVAVPSGLCGLCVPSPYERALAAMSA